jgi:steroid delta-isomerase-like uncharacterized protein
LPFHFIFLTFIESNIMELEPQYRSILQKHVIAETAFQMQATLDTLTSDCVFEDMPTGQKYLGHDGVKAYYNEWWSAFGNTPSGSKRYVPSTDCLIVETHFVGSHQGSYAGIAATGRPINLPVAIFVSFKDGLMSGERFYYDRATLIAQISPVEGAAT